MTWHFFTNLLRSHGTMTSKQNTLKVNKNFGVIGKKTWFWSTFNEKPRVNFEVNKRQVSKIVRPGAKNVKLNLLTSVQAVITIFWIFWIKKTLNKKTWIKLFWHFESELFTKWYFSNLGLKKTDICKWSPPESLNS